MKNLKGPCRTRWAALPGCLHGSQGCGVKVKHQKSRPHAQQAWVPRHIIAAGQLHRPSDQWSLWPLGSTTLFKTQLNYWTCNFWRLPVKKNRDSNLDFQAAAARNKVCPARTSLQAWWMPSTKTCDAGRFLGHTDGFVYLIHPDTHLQHTAALNHAVSRIFMQHPFRQTGAGITRPQESKAFVHRRFGRCACLSPSCITKKD